jgi:hypothetical protein
MPEVIHGNIGCQAFAIGPREIAPMLAEMDGFRLGTSSGTRALAHLERLDDAK